MRTEVERDRGARHGKAINNRQRPRVSSSK